MILCVRCTTAYRLVSSFYMYEASCQCCSVSIHSIGIIVGSYNCCASVQIKLLENENELLEKNENSLKESMEALLQSREAFIKHYEAGIHPLCFSASFGLPLLLS